MKNTVRVFIRMPLKLKDDVKTVASKEELSFSEYTRIQLEMAVNNASHEHQIQHAIQENGFINGLLASTELPDKSKKIISKELRKYVGYTN